MKISLKWLSDYINVAEDLKKPQELVKLLTEAGLEVEGLENLSERFKNVVTGVILEKKQHPSADRLSVCQVSTGQGIVHQIVCGAKNHKEGDHVVAALPGAVLPGDFAIKVSVLRGVESAGMLCSESELGLQEEAEGIMILPNEAPVGMGFAEYMNKDDIIFEIKVTPNRADCLSHFGLAREIAAIRGQEYQFPLCSFEENGDLSTNKISLEVIEPELCPRYSGRYLSAVKVGQSPSWLKARLESVGMKSINNVVDITNYVMLELGQPMHAFDVRQLRDEKILVSMAKKGEVFETLDGTKLTLAGSELMIRDGERAVALAGVVGGENSGVVDDTTDIFLESAYFSAAGVRRASRQHGIETESGYRFSRGVNPDACLLALNRATELLIRLAGASAHPGPHDFYPKKVLKTPIVIKNELLTQRLGYPVKIEDFTHWMQRIGCEVTAEDQSASVLPPVYRWDINIDMDLVEEFSRLHGYDKIPEHFPELRNEPTHDHKEQTFTDKITTALRGFGFHQAVNLAFAGKAEVQKWLGDIKKYPHLEGVDLVQLRNPLSEDLGYMRATLMSGLFRSFLTNYRHNILSGSLFEVGYTFQQGIGEYPQSLRLSMILWGEEVSLWKGQAPIVMKLKGVLEAVEGGLGSSFQYKECDIPTSFFHPYQSAQVMFRDLPLGIIGHVHPQILEDEKVRHPVAVVEIKLDPFLAIVKAPIKIKTPSKFPAVERDLAFVGPEEVSAGVIVAHIKAKAGEFLERVEIFDQFNGAPLVEGERSLAFRLRFQNPKDTLTDEAVNQAIEKLVEGINSALGLRLR